MLVARSLCQQYAEALISRDDYLHLLGKELGRLIVVGGGATLATSLMPVLVSRTQCVILACAVCAVAYVASDLIYNLLAHAVMRLVLLPIWGKVWLLSQTCPEGHASYEKRS
mmetsp:Transcript_64897/g.128230  ORF Transcript_64897/g.128230 Transcript_64897/m.128230 type:complete len:112 (+) Transcript_64897:1-336(+)